jgi:hypothetical protein
MLMFCVLISNVDTLFYNFIACSFFYNNFLYVCFYFTLNTLSPSSLSHLEDQIYLTIDLSFNVHLPHIVTNTRVKRLTI